VLSRHSTQVVVAGLQYAPPRAVVQVVVPQVTTQAPFVQVPPLVQSVSTKHPTQAPVVVLQTSLVQLALLVHSTHAAGVTARLQTGVPPEQSVSAVQLVVQALFTQTWPAVVQLASVRHATQVCVVSLQYGRRAVQVAVPQVAGPPPAPPCAARPPAVVPPVLAELLPATLPPPLVAPVLLEPLVAPVLLAPVLLAPVLLAPVLLAPVLLAPVLLAPVLLLPPRLEVPPVLAGVVSSSSPPHAARIMGTAATIRAGHRIASLVMGCLLTLGSEDSIAKTTRKAKGEIDALAKLWGRISALSLPPVLVFVMPGDETRHTRVAT
jgi:hypothetical protein